MAKSATPWGPAELVEELTVPQQAGQKRFASKLQLLETAKGERLGGVAHHRPSGGGGRPGPPPGAGKGRLQTAPPQVPGLAGAVRVETPPPAPEGASAG